MKEGLHRAAWLAAIYPMLLAMLLGATWMDRSWYLALQAALPGPALEQTSRAVGDALLWLVAMVLLSGGIAAWLWEGTTRLLCISSVTVLCLEFVAPALVSALPGGRHYLAEIGPFMRSAIHLTALGLAALALRRSLA